MKLHITLLLFLFSTLTRAGTLLDIHYTSYHTEAKGIRRSEEFNEDNRGVGITTDYFTEDGSVSIGAYKNSLYRTSIYLTYNIHIIDTKYYDLSLKAGVVTNYDIPVVFSVVPMFSVGGDYKVNFSVIPPELNNGIGVGYVGFSYRIN